ncbi:MAG: CDP-archaeol synthase [Desulfobacterales bacterium]|jgi:predicted MPP superfamily phosphohydrolase|nr:CDP-archaeol synthase [Desulfobacterales bacterium]
MVVAKTLFLIVLINSVPLFLHVLFPKISRWPLDNHYLFRDGRPLLGAHKTISGFLSGILAGAAGAALIGLPVWAGVAAGFFGMFGDCLSSFIKRRFRAKEGADFPALDHMFESGFPLLFCYFFFSITWLETLITLLLFIAGGWAIKGVRKKAFSSPKAAGLSLVRSTIRFRQWRACHTALTPVARLLNFENIIYYRLFMTGFFKLTGLYEKGVTNALNVRVTELSLSFPRFPKALSPYRILFISDLHIDGIDGLSSQLISRVREIDADICLLGGDYRMEMYGSFFKAKQKLSELVRHIRTRDGIFGILGNHDCIELAPDLEQAGLYMLINDSVSITKNGAALNIAGVDDPHYYKCHSLKAAYEDVSKDDFSILMAHSPEIIKDIDGFPVDLCLCGHTHGGQIRLPGVGAVFTHCKTRREYTSGLWRYNGVTGYTSTGAGSSGIPVRFNCPPEVVVLTLSSSTAGQQTA